MYVPKHFHFAISTAISLLGFYIKHKFGDTYDVVIVFLALQYHAVIHSLYIFKAGTMYQAYITQAPPKAEPITNWHTGAEVEDIPPPASDGFIPLGRKAAQTVPVYNQVVSLPRFDKERYFAFTIVRMRDNGFKVDMTETRWVKNWKFSRGEFTSMLDNWKSHGIIERESDKKNSRYAIMKWEAVKLISQGNPLPPPH